VIKLNFDGASEGNLSKAGHGGIFRNHEGKPLLLYFGSIGWDTNNSAELEGLWQGMSLANQHNFHPVIIEEDSQILINMATQIQMGTPDSKVATSWRLEARLELIERQIKNKRAITFIHVKREGNKVVDLLANTGVKHDQVLQSGSINILNDKTQSQECTDLVHKEAQLLDAGVHQNLYASGGTRRQVAWSHGPP